MAILIQHIYACLCKTHTHTGLLLPGHTRVDVIWSHRIHLFGFEQMLTYISNYTQYNIYINFHLYWTKIISEAGRFLFFILRAIFNCWNILKVSNLSLDLTQTHTQTHFLDWVVLWPPIISLVSWYLNTDCRFINRIKVIKTSVSQKTIVTVCVLLWAALKSHSVTLHLDWFRSVDECIF